MHGFVDKSSSIVVQESGLEPDLDSFPLCQDDTLWIFHLWLKP